MQRGLSELEATPRLLQEPLETATARSRRVNGGALLRWTAEGGCPYVVHGGRGLNFGYKSTGQN